ncbi:hypothetical protein F4810DRAFT_435557 [Camillea tinctor]|nr:hypothetical protein F4810DRAFT_435557 [Camillea tinctor]
MKMCKFNYTGFEFCGHIDPEGTPVKHELCGFPTRLRHEPMCDPPDSYGLSTNGAQYCPECKPIIDRLQAEWTAKRDEWRTNKALPDAQISRINREIIASRAIIGKQAVQKGPHHNENQRYEPEQQAIINAAEKLIETYKKLDDAWKENTCVLKNFGTVPQGTLNGCNRRRSIAKHSMKESGPDLLAEFENDLLDEMYEIHNKKTGLLG